MISLVSDRRRWSAGPDELDALDRLVSVVHAAAAAGIDVIQIRERDLSTAELVSLTARCVAAVKGTPARVVVNDRTDVALAAGAHGVHLRGDSIEARRVRELLPAGALVGRSVHTAAEAAAIAREGGVDYLIFGTLFPTPSKHGPYPLTPVAELAAACAAARGTVPVLAIGGMTVERAAAAVRAGAAGIAAIGLFIPPDGASPDAHVRAVATALRRVFDTCEAVP